LAGAFQGDGTGHHQLTALFFLREGAWDSELTVLHADERGLKREAGRLLGGPLARGGHSAVRPASQGYIQIVYPEHAGLPGRVPGGENGGLKPLAVCSPMAGVGKDGITTA
jgi:hypothetical protein